MNATVVVVTKDVTLALTELLQTQPESADNKFIAISVFSTTLKRKIANNVLLVVTNVKLKVFVGPAEWE
jgi:hypothetical protein